MADGCEGLSTKRQVRQLKRRQSIGRLRMVRAVRGVVSAGVLVLALSALLGPGSAHAAARFYWYGENNSTCWQKTGEVAAETGQECDYVGEWYLNSSNPVRTLEGALSGDLQLSQSGDYCNNYTKNPPAGVLYTRDANNESGLTGFNPLLPDSMTTANGDYLCQALGAQWGQGLRPAHVPGNCTGEYQPCGVHHEVSFVSQAQGLRPWSKAFTSPILIVEGASYPGRVNVPGGGWAYLCPILEDVGSSNGQLLEYCFVEWEKSGYVNFRGLVNQTGAPAAVQGHRMCPVFTAFQLGTSFSTEIAGSGNTYTLGESPWIGPFKAGITEGNLLNAIRAANSAPCYEGDSEDLTKYALIGVEQGIEGANIGEFGARTENLSLATEYFGLNVAPKAVTQPTTELKATSAQLHGSVNPEGSSTEAYFEYSTEQSFAHSSRIPAPSGWQIGEGMTYIPAYVTLEGLTPNTTYYDRVVGHNAAGTTHGEPAQFHTLGVPPAVSTKPATSVTETGATLNGTVNPEGSETKYYFEYGTTKSYGSKTAEASAGAGSANVEVSKAITGLATGTTYYFRVVATNGSGTSYGLEKSFPTTAKPTVETKPTTNVGETTATLNGAVNPKAAETKYYFDYGTTISYGTKTAEVSAGSGTTNVEVSKDVTGLTASTTYHVRIVATNSNGTAYGADAQFTTGSGGATIHTQTVDSGHSLNAVSCISATTTCVVSDSVGSALRSSNVSVTVTSTWTAWGGPGTSPSEAIACPSTSLCLLTDGSNSGNGGNLYYATSLGGAWTQAYSPTYGVDAISCVSSSFCVDGQDGAGYFRYSTSPASINWTLEDQGTASANAVFCLSSSFCAIADSAGNVRIATTTSQIESSTWTSTNVDGSSALHGIACTSTTSCTAVDGAGNVLNLTVAGGGSATVSKHNIDGTNNLTAVTCTTGATCVTVDSAGSIFVSTNSGASWTKKFTTSTNLTSVSCSSGTLCVTADTTGKVTAFKPS